MLLLLHHICCLTTRRFEPCRLRFCPANNFGLTRTHSTLRPGIVLAPLAYTLPPPSPEWVGEWCASAYLNSLVRWRSVCVERDASLCVIATPRPSSCVVVTSPYLISLHVAHSGQQSIQSFGYVLTPLHSLSSFPHSAMTIAIDRFIPLSLLFRDRPDQSTTTFSCRRADARNDSQQKEVAHIAATSQDQVPDFFNYVITLVRQQASLSSSLSVT